jgi:hypothetical protein
MNKTSLTKVEKNRIKEAHPTETYTDEEWAILQGMTHSDFRQPTALSAFFDAVDEKLKNSKVIKQS